MSEQVIVRRNVLTNPSFETDLAGWAAGLTRSNSIATRVRAGTYYAQTGTGTSVDTVKYPAGAGQAWTASGYLSRGATDKSAAVQPVFFDTAGTELSVTIPANVLIPAIDTPARFSGTRTAPAGTTQVALRVYFTGLITMDAFLLEQTDTLGEYFDGSTLLEGHTFAWTGTAHASASTNTYTVTVVDPPTGVELAVREAGAWVQRTATPNVRVNDAWLPVYPKRWDAATNSWIAL